MLNSYTQKNKYLNLSMFRQYLPSKHRMAECKVHTACILKTCFRWQAMPNLFVLQNVWEIYPYMLLLYLLGLCPSNSVSFQPLSHRDLPIVPPSPCSWPDALRRPEATWTALKYLRSEGQPMYLRSDGVQTVAWHRLTRTKVDKDKRDHLVVRTETKALNTNSQQEYRSRPVSSKNFKGSLVNF